MSLASIVACVRPLLGYRAHGGVVHLGARKGDFYGFVPKAQVRCGYCVGCLEDRASEWSVRMLHEAQTYLEERDATGAPRPRSSSFVTLTYAPEFLPRDWGLHVSEWQGFAKRLRHRVGPFRFFMSGEYGSANLRPHFHAILFGVEFSDRVPFARNEVGDERFVSATLSGVWGKGRCEIGSVTPRSTAYVAKYVMKRGRENSERYRRRDGDRVWYVRPEFCTMSRRPGIGYRWFQKYAGDVFPADELVVRGRRRRTPRYYDRLLSEEHGDVLDQVKVERRLRAAKFADALSPERLAAREKILESRGRRQREM